ncbi:MAG: sulfurtransferase [Thermoanaerobaculia bacterium]
MNVVILDARTPEAYAAGHLEGALHADLETQLSAPGDPAKGGRHPLPPLDRWLRQVEEWGITPETRVIVYDDANGANAATRVWWMLRAIGHENVEVLSRESILSEALDPPSILSEAKDQWSPHRNGAMNASREGTPDPSPSSRLRIDTWQLPTVTMEQVDQLRNDPRWLVLDVRSAERFRGETEPFDPVAGHIPGAVNLPYTENIGKSPQELRAMYERLLGDVPPERLVVHCGSGVTACHTLLALEQAGLPGASLYVGSWGEWCRNKV